ncbi:MULTISPECIES: AmmeMemoRadiSam system protein A [Dictyoglomus]|jgi:AmmeMemoRadiSam system protein A|uniref:AMMECR1 domain protein n=1 Tax=Dictyoglomus turgidum (strain DSM 6724 / Z-1310) TaxID=515635 RepID=B8E1G8_DICTD|nr:MULTISPECIES: AmmeMemoRadiSam system protein A [Dictyoglomus]ACK42296.1 AMMECR1 domain protein [Dictyoglomus turgidum DSM 6724]PNV80611.1 MAG: AmmeMemoRadiSam system protein A [Dictyoglomus turgidum]HBU31975.1 AmmeMemoRadiSam system protein A [Dictyoglomus sp.]
MDLREYIVGLARKAIETYLKEGRVITPPPDIPDYLKRKAGTFVSLHRKSTGELRGCIGTIIPTTSNIAEEIIRNAISAATEDPRFPPLDLDELDDIEISVDVLSPLEEIKDIKDLDPKKYGVVVEKGWRRGVLLPDLEGVDTIEEQLSIALAKAGISPSENFKVYRFSVDRFKE